MKHHFSIVAAALLCVAAGDLVHAGQKSGCPLTIHRGAWGDYAEGSFADARGAADPVAGLGCSVTSYTDMTFVSCYARTTADAAYCYSYSPSLIAAATALSDDGLLQFAWNAAGECTWINASKDSAIAPRLP
jgi:hypothetical protein